MFLDDCQIPIHLKPQSTSYKVFYDYRKNQLLEYMMQLFTWHGLPDSIPAHEPDLYLFMWGRCAFNKDRKKNELIAVIPEMSGPTNYFDEFTNYTWSTPIQGGRQYKDVNGIIVSNTGLHNSSFPLIHSTAAKLAHLDTTIICAAVNQRDTVAVTAINQKFANDAKQYQRQKYNGVPSFVVDKGFTTLEFRDMKTNSMINIREYCDTEQLILTEFWETIGVNKTVEKRERLITAEADSNSQLLKLNIRNMYNSRVAGVKKVNEMFGTNISVECNVDIVDKDITETVPDEMKEGEEHETLDKENR